MKLPKIVKGRLSRSGMVSDSVAVAPTAAATSVVAVTMTIAAAIGLISPAPSRALTLTEAAQAVLRANPVMAAAEAESDAAQGAVSTARASYFPGVALSGAYTHGNNPVYAFGTRLGQSRFETGDFALDNLNHPSSVANLQGQAGLQIQILNWQRKPWLDAARAGGNAARENQQASRQQLVGQAIEAYYGLLLARRQSDILRERIEESDGEIKDATRLKDQGLVLGSDFHLARSLLGRLKQQRARAESQALSAQAALNILMSRPEDDAVDVSSSLVAAELPALDIRALNEDLARHPALRSAQYSAEGASADARAESRSRWPALSGFSVVEGNGYKMDQGGWNHLSGVKLGVPLFDPGRGPRSDAKASAARGMEAAQRITRDRLRINLQSQYRAFESARERLALALETEQEARSALVQFKKLYRAGRQSIADVLQGEANLAQSQADLQQVYFDLRVGYARALQAAGRLDDVPEVLAR